MNLAKIAASPKHNAVIFTQTHAHFAKYGELTSGRRRREAASRYLKLTNNSIASSIEETLLDEFSDEYSDNGTGVKDWLKIQQVVALVKKSFKGNAVPSHATVKRIIEEKYEDKILNLKSSGSMTKRQSSCTSIETKLASYGVEFLAKKRKVNNAMTVLQPLSLQEEKEQIRMATTLSMHDKKNTVCQCRTKSMQTATAWSQTTKYR